MPAGEGPAPQRPVGEMPEDLVEHFDSRWLGTGEYEASLASDSLDYTRGPAFHPRGGHPSAAASSHQSGFAWPSSCRESPEVSLASDSLDYTRGAAFHPRGGRPSAAASSLQSGFAWSSSCRESPEASAAFSVLA